MTSIPRRGSPDRASKIVIAHRGASGYLPEHTLEAYALAHGMGADFIEPDLVRTRDGVFICVHDLYLEDTTDVEERFPDRARADGRWYAADFDLAEIRQLRVHERLPNRFPMGSSRFEVPTFSEMIELVQGLNRTTGREVGIYPEMKGPEFHRGEGLPMEEELLAVLARYGYDGPSAPVFIQSFEPDSLQRLRSLGSTFRQVLLVGGGEAADAFLTPEGLDRVSTFADGIGPAKELILRRPEIVGWAHERHLVVHPYTFRADDLPPGVDDFDEELARYYDEIGVDGLFTDFADLAVAFLHGVPEGGRR